MLPSNQNEHITSKLQVLQQACTNTGDRWRSFAYAYALVLAAAGVLTIVVGRRRAIKALKALPYKVTSPDQVQDLPGVGARIARKVALTVSYPHCAFSMTLSCCCR